MSRTLEILPYRVGDRTLGVTLARVQKLVRAALVTPLPEAPPTIAGVINVQGEVMPVVDMRTKLGLPPRPISLHDVFLLVHAGAGPVALWVDHVDSAATVVLDELSQSSEILGEMDFVVAATQYQDELLLVIDMDELLAPEQAVLRLARLDPPTED
jgi:purine-binding chemotaxis protein CheW